MALQDKRNAGTFAAPVRPAQTNDSARFVRASCTNRATGRIFHTSGHKAAFVLAHPDSAR
jgi:hypothetical protein